MQSFTPGVWVSCLWSQIPRTQFYHFIPISGPFFSAFLRSEYSWFYSVCIFCIDENSVRFYTCYRIMEPTSYVINYVADFLILLRFLYCVCQLYYFYFLGSQGRGHMPPLSVTEAVSSIISLNPSSNLWDKDYDHLPSFTAENTEAQRGYDIGLKSPIEKAADLGCPGPPPAAPASRTHSLTCRPALGGWDACRPLEQERRALPGKSRIRVVCGASRPCVFHFPFFNKIRSSYRQPDVVHQVHQTKSSLCAALTKGNCHLCTDGGSETWAAWGPWWRRAVLPRTSQGRGRFAPQIHTLYSHFMLFQSELLGLISSWCLQVSFYGWGNRPREIGWLIQHYSASVGSWELTLD